MSGEEAAPKREDGGRGTDTKLAVASSPFSSWLGSPTAPGLGACPEREGNEEDWREWQIARQEALAMAAQERRDRGDEPSHKAYGDVSGLQMPK